MKTIDDTEAERIKADAARIEALGGPAEVARRLNYDTRKGGTQRVQNWLKRGIPSDVKVKHPALFMDQLQPKAPRPARTAV